MNVVFHTLVSLGLGCAAAARLDAGGRPAPTLAGAFGLAILSHGVLDGLKHLYPLSSGLDVILALLFFAGWLALVPRRRWPLFVLLFAGAILPDLIDLGPRMANRHLGLDLPLPRAHLFPWHWPEGSGSLYDGRDAAVSLTNHLIVVAFSLAAILNNRRALRKTSERR
jgi:hypothetical protein